MFLHCTFLMFLMMLEQLECGPELHRCEKILDLNENDKKSRGADMCAMLTANQISSSAYRCLY